MNIFRFFKRFRCKHQFHILKQDTKNVSNVPGYVKEVYMLQQCINCDKKKELYYLIPIHGDHLEVIPNRICEACNEKFYIENDQSDVRICTRCYF